jgi:hypothetical protein
MSSEKVQQPFAYVGGSHISYFFTENMRRMFYKWLAATRKVKHKRVTLREREYEMQKIQLEAAWDKWRGRFQEERLLPLVGAILPARCALQKPD